MSRLSQANQLWATLLGGGRGTAGRQAAVRQNMGTLPVTPEVIAAATQGMGAAGRQRFTEEILQGGGNPFTRGSGGGGSRTPHYGPLTGETSEIQFTDHGSGQTFHTVESSPEDQAELARRAAIQQEQLDSGVVDTFNTVLRGEYQRQPAAFAEVYRPAIAAIASGRMPSPENDALIVSRRRKETTQKAAIVDYLSQNAGSFSEGEIRDVWQQHYQQFPEFAEGQQPPMTREERLAEKRDQEETQFQNSLNEFSKANGLPNIPVRRNEKGVLEPLVNIETMVSSRRQSENAALTAASRDANAMFRARVAAAKAKMPQRPGVDALGNPNAQADYQAAADAVSQEIQSAYEELERTLGGGATSPVATPASPPPPADTPQQLPPSTFNNGQDAERAFDAGRLQPDQPFTVGGVTVAFDQNGNAYRVE